jgi:uncharacterized protein YegJ (DUF2314 family)
MQSPDEPPHDPDENAPQGPSEDAWNAAPTQPSAWVGFWPHPDAPSQEEVGRAIANWVGREVEAEAGQPDAEEGMIWALMLNVPGVASPVVVWAERALAADSAQLPDESMRACKWVIGMQTMLEQGEQYAEYFHLVSMLAGSLPELTGLLDVSNGRRYSRTELDSQFLASDAVPNDEFVWTITAIAPDDTDDAPMMLFTTGLARCGLPELELLEVPSRHAQTAAVLMNHVASLLLEDPPPAPGEPMEIGPDIEVALVKWREYAKTMADETPGSLAFRRVAGSEDDGPLTGIRAVICAPEQKGAYAKAWTWPREVIERMESGRAVLYASEHSAVATQRRAQRTWPAFATAFASLRRADMPDVAALAPQAFHVQAPVGGADEQDRREQGWFLVQTFDGDEVEATLVDNPVTTTAAHAGDTVRVKRTEITDWRVLLPGDVYGPDASDQLMQAVDRLRGIE